MSTETVDSGPDTWVGSAKPTLGHPGYPKLALEASVALAFIKRRPTLPDNATVTSATLRFFAAGASSGARTLTVQRIANQWKPGETKTTFNDQPGVIGTTVTAAVDVLADGDVIDFDVTAHVAAIAAGSDHYGWRLITDSATRHKVYSTDSDYPPQLIYTYTVAPATPTSLRPNHGVVADPQPTVSCDYSDLDGSDLAYIQVQTNSTADMTTPAFDSGWVASTVPELDLSTTLFTAMTDGQTVYWRCRVQAADGGESAWSDVFSFSYSPQGTITDTSGTTVTDTNPDASWTFTGTQTAYQVRYVLASDPSIILHDSGKRVSTVTTYGTPTGVIDDDSLTYRRIIRIWDDKDREAVPGAPTYAKVQTDFTVVDGTGSAPTAVTAAKDPVTPKILVDFTMATAPDYVTVYRDGEVIDALLVPADLLVSGTSYQYGDWTADPLTTHSYQLRAVTAGNQSPKSAAGTVTPVVDGLWLVDTKRDLWISMRGLPQAGWRRSDTFAIYWALGADAPIKVTSTMQGLAGTFDGELYDGDDGRTAADQAAVLYQMLTYPDRKLRLIVGDRNIPVYVADLGESVHPELMGDDDRKLAGFQFWQAGERKFSPRL